MRENLAYGIEEGLMETAVMACLSGTLDPKGEKRHGLT